MLISKRSAISSGVILQVHSSQVCGSQEGRGESVGFRFLSPDFLNDLFRYRRSVSPETDAVVPQGNMSDLVRDCVPRPSPVRGLISEHRIRRAKCALSKIEKFCERVIPRFVVRHFVIWDANIIPDHPLIL
jgi:hypothetical protein